MNAKTNMTDPRSLGNRRFAKAKSLAHKLEIHSKTIFRWADAGCIARYKVNPRVVLFDEAEVMEYIEKSRVLCLQKLSGRAAQ